MSKKKICIIIITLILLIATGSFIYYSYFYYVEGRNSKQNVNALHIHTLTNRYIGDNIESINDMILSNNKKTEMNNINSIDIDEILKSYSQSYNIPYDDGSYYVEIRNKEVYKVIYAKWKYSGFVGTSPEPNGVCKVYQTEVNKALEGFKAYMENK